MENHLKNIERLRISVDQNEFDRRVEIRCCTTLQGTQLLVNEMDGEHRQI